jgi:hypothetical protein
MRLAGRNWTKNNGSTPRAAGIRVAESSGIEITVTMEISVPLTELSFEILLQQAAPGSSAARALEASSKNVIKAGVRKIFTVRCTIDVAQELQLLAAQSCPPAASIIASVIDARAPELIWVKRRVAAR